MIVIVRPATGEINQGQLIALAAAVGFGVSVAMMKSLTRTEKTVAIIFWMLVVQSAAGLLPALYVWQWPSAHTWGWIVVIAFCGTFSHYCMARAMLHADATVVLPMDFLRVPLTATLGWLIVFGAAGHVHRARRDADPDRQSPEPETTGASSRTRGNLIALPAYASGIRISFRRNAASRSVI